MINPPPLIFIILHLNVMNNQNDVGGLMGVSEYIPIKENHNVANSDYDDLQQFSELNDFDYHQKRTQKPLNMNNVPMQLRGGNNNISMIDSHMINDIHNPSINIKIPPKGPNQLGPKPQDFKLNNREYILQKIHDNKIKQNTTSYLRYQKYTQEIFKEDYQKILAGYFDWRMIIKSDPNSIQARNEMLQSILQIEADSENNDGVEV